MTIMVSARIYDPERTTNNVIKYRAKKKKDKSKNSITGKNVMSYDLKNCFVNLPNNKLAVIQGLDDFIVVESNGILLICNKKEEQKIKNFVNDVRLQKGEDHI